MELSKIFRFEASHQISNHPGKCANLHGHSWVLTVYVEGSINNETGMVADFFDIKKIIKPIIDRLDHTHLGSGSVNVNPNPPNLAAPAYVWLPPSHEQTLPELPTSENMLLWIAAQIPIEFQWSKMTINETCTSSATLTRKEFFQTPQGREIATEEMNKRYGGKATSI